MQNTVRTIYGAMLQDCQHLNLPLTVPENSTLNERLEIFPEEKLGDNQLPSVDYIAIGIGGHKFTIGADNIPVPEPIQHTPRHAGLYKQLPFVLREVNNDLLPSERQRYRLRRYEEHDGKVYVAYYLKKMDKSKTLPQMELRHVENNQVTSTTFKPTLADLNPVPPVIRAGAPAVIDDNVYTTTGDYIAATAKVPFLMSIDDIDEFMNVCNIIYGNPNYAIISEIATCSGVDRTLMGNFNGIQAPYTESVAVQVTNFISAIYMLSFINDELNVTFDVGSVEPLLELA